jgi:hypothetical protein
MGSDADADADAGAGGRLDTARGGCGNGCSKRPSLAVTV